MTSKAFPKASTHDLIIVAKELIAGRTLDQYTWEEDVIGHLNGDKLTYLVHRKWSESKEQINDKRLYKKERQYLEENFADIAIPQARMDKLCSLMYFNWTLESINQNGLEIHAELSRRDEKMTLTFSTEVDLYFPARLFIWKRYPELTSNEKIMNDLSRLTYYGWTIRNITFDSNETTVKLARGQQRMDMKFN